MVSRFPRPFAAHLPRGGRHFQRLLQGTHACDVPCMWCAYACNEEDGTPPTPPPLATQIEPAETQAAIARLAETPVELEEEEEEVDDNRPRWDRPSDRWGQTESGGGSEIP